MTSVKFGTFPALYFFNNLISLISSNIHCSHGIWCKMGRCRVASQLVLWAHLELERDQVQVAGLGQRLLWGYTLTRYGGLHPGCKFHKVRENAQDLLKSLTQVMANRPSARCFLQRMFSNSQFSLLAQSCMIRCWKSRCVLAYWKVTGLEKGRSHQRNRSREVHTRYIWVSTLGTKTWNIICPQDGKKNTNIWCCLTIWNPLPWHGQTCEQQFDKCTSLTHPHVGLTENTPHPTLPRHVFD